MTFQKACDTCTLEIGTTCPKPVCKDMVVDENNHLWLSSEPSTFKEILERMKQ